MSDVPRSAWFALLAPPVAWFVALNGAYFAVDWACGSVAGLITLHAVVLAMFTLSIVAGVAGVRLWRRLGSERPGESASPVATTRLIAIVGTFGGALFSVAILWFWIAALVLSPCEPSPHPRFAPSADARIEVIGRGSG